MTFIVLIITVTLIIIIGAGLTVWCGALVDDNDRLADHQSKLEFNKLRGDEK